MNSRRRLGLAATVLVLGALIAFAFFWLRGHLFDKAAMALKQGDHAEAATNLRRAATMGDPKAQLLMGDFYALGWGVAKDDDEAIAWYRRAGADGEDVRDPAAPAMYYIGKKYLEGQGIPRNEAEARKWFEKSAQGGFAKAAEQLSHMPANQPLNP